MHDYLASISDQELCAAVLIYSLLVAALAILLAELIERRPRKYSAAEVIEAYQLTKLSPPKPRKHVAKRRK